MVRILPSRPDAPSFSEPGKLKKDGVKTQAIAVRIGLGWEPEGQDEAEAHLAVGVQSLPQSRAIVSNPSYGPGILFRRNPAVSGNLQYPLQ